MNAMCLEKNLPNPFAGLADARLDVVRIIVAETSTIVLRSRTDIQPAIWTIEQINEKPGPVSAARELLDSFLTGAFWGAIFGVFLGLIGSVFSIGIYVVTAVYLLAPMSSAEARSGPSMAAAKNPSPKNTSTAAPETPFKTEKYRQSMFASPAEAVTAFLDAVGTNNVAVMGSILGPDGGKLINSGDAIFDEQRRVAFTENYHAANKLRMEGDTRAILLVGKDEWALPIPLVKSSQGWRFDTNAGINEILHRRIGENELAAIQVMRTIVEAQREYVAADQDRNGVLEYAAKIISAPGKHDGLYWPADENASQGSPALALSPLGPLVAAATLEGYAGRTAHLEMLQREPYHGYYYRILNKQGSAAHGGAYDYVVNGKMIGGFAVIAYPARYGASGVMSFMVNHDGEVFEKDLGTNTVSVAEKVKVFNPSTGWKRP
jgi:hypothetical protein